MTKRLSREGNRWGNSYPIKNMAKRSADPKTETPFRNEMAHPHHKAYSGAAPLRATSPAGGSCPGIDSG